MRKLPIGIQTSLHRFGKRSLIPYQSDRRDIVKVCHGICRRTEYHKMAM